jgi:uncharacterized protein (DUF983 family)
MPPSSSTPLQVALSLIGLAAVGASIWVAFVNPYSLWPWLLLAVGLGCAMASRRMK